MSAGVLAGDRVAVLAGRRLSVDVGDLAAWLLPFVSIFYLGLSGGGYDTVIRDQIGIVLWWMILIGALAGVFPTVIERRGWCAIGLFAGFLGWVALSLAWTESAERSATEVARVAMLLAVLLLGLRVAGRGRQSRVVAGVATATALIATLAVVSRLRPEWFPADDVANSLGDGRRLSYPLNYWNALAALTAMGIPAVLSVAVGGRSLVLRSIYAAALPVMGLCVYLTLSRAGVIAVVVGLVVFMLLAPDRLPKFGTIGIVGVATAILLMAADARPALRNGVLARQAEGDAGELLLIIAVTTLGAACLQMAWSLLERHGDRPSWTMPSPGRSRRFAAMGAGTVIVLAFVALGAPRSVQNEWEEFKSPKAEASIVADSPFERLASISGSGRYQYWQAAVDQQASRPLQGTGAGTFEYWWARNRGETGGFVRDAHSLYLQTFGELGLIGLLLLAAFLVWVVGIGVVRTLQLPEEHRLPASAATAAIAAFGVAAGIDWVWQVTVVPLTLMFMASVVLAAPQGEDRSRPGLRRRVLVCAAAFAGLIPIGMNLAGASAVADSHEAAARGDLAAALGYARSAVRTQPFAATPRLQEALVLEAMGDLSAAEVAAVEATKREPTNWRTWLVRARLAAERGEPSKALSLFRTARSLNPRSTIFSAG